MRKRHYVYKWVVREKYPWPYLVTVYSCGDIYIKRLRIVPEVRARRVTKDYLQGCFPEWYKLCGLFHVEQSNERG